MTVDLSQSDIMNQFKRLGSNDRKTLRERMDNLDLENYDGQASYQPIELKLPQSLSTPVQGYLFIANVDFLVDLIPKVIKPDETDAALYLLLVSERNITLQKLEDSEGLMLWRLLDGDNPYERVQHVVKAMEMLGYYNPSVTNQSAADFTDEIAANLNSQISWVTKGSWGVSKKTLNDTLTYYVLARNGES